MTFDTTVKLVETLHARKVSARELLEQSIARIEACDGRINAVVVRDFERARAAAAAADAALGRGERRPLLGVPVTVKEAFNVAGLPTTWGIPGTERIEVREDAVAVRRLKEAGAVVLGKTNVPTQLADWQTRNPIHGTTNNPWDLARTPGGSSGGSAAALAAGFVPLELGTDLNGSLRVPAHCCGVFAHKPTHGLVPLRGLAPPGTPVLSVAPDIDLAVVGPMARSAADLALALDVLAGPDHAAATAYRLALPPPRHATLGDFRVLVLEDHPMLPLAKDVRSALHGLADALARAGCRIGRGSPLVPDLELQATTFGTLLMSFIGADMPEAEYRGLQRAAADLPPGAGAELRAMVASHRDWIHADRVRAGIAHAWRQLFREWDVVLCPVLPTTAFPHDDRAMEERRIVVDGKPIAYTQQALWASLATLAGLPATALPIGRSAEGLPIGVQIVGPYLEDRTTIEFARLVEGEFGGFAPPPELAATRRR
jgi:amidase